MTPSSHAAGGGVERVAELLAVGRRRTSRPSSRELVGALALGLDGADQALVLELLERGVDRAGARLPDALGAALDLLDELVAVLRLLVQQERAARRGRRRAGRGRRAAAAAAMAAGAAGASPGRPQNIALNCAGRRTGRRGRPS